MNPNTAPEGQAQQFQNPNVAPSPEATASPPVAGATSAETMPQERKVDPNFPHLSASNVAQSTEVPTATPSPGTAIA